MIAMAEQYVSNINGYLVKDQKAHDRLDALGTSGGESVETCTIIFERASYQNALDVIYTTKNGLISCISFERGDSDVTITDVMCGSVFTIIPGVPMVWGGGVPNTLLQNQKMSMCKAPNQSGTFIYDILLDD